MASILPSGEELLMTPDEILRYLNPDGFRQLLRQERLHWNLKPNRDVDYIDKPRQFKYSGSLHNDGRYQLMEIRSFPDNGAFAGYAGLYIDTGIFGMIHELDLWDRAMSEDSLSRLINRTVIGAMATTPGHEGFGLDERKNMVKKTQNRMAAMVFDPWDGRAYLFSNDDPHYVNNETRAPDERIPDRAVARMADVPTRVTQLINDLDFVADPDYHHTDNNFTNSNRFIVDNLDDRTFVYPEISKDSSGRYIENIRVGLNGENVYGESDSLDQKFNTQDRSVDGEDEQFKENINSHGANINFNGLTHPSGYFPGIFRSLEELERVDLIGQLRTPLDQLGSPGGRRTHNYYLIDGQWSPTWFDRFQYNDSYLAQSMNPVNMEIHVPAAEPVPFAALNQTGDQYSTAKLYQWRYNRVSLKYDSDDIVISVIESGEEYRVGDILRWTFGDDVFLFEVTQVGANGQILAGSYAPKMHRIFEQDPSTHGVGVKFYNMSGVGRNAKLAISCPVRIESNATQIKNNLYAYVDVTPTVPSDNTSDYSDINLPDSQGGIVTIRSTAPGPAYSGINSGRGGPAPSQFTEASSFFEHGGNATAGVHVHLFRYVINTQNPSWVVKDGVQIFTGRWVDQGPMGLERPCDIKALLFSNPDCNNFNNYYKFTLDSFFATLENDPDGVETNNENALSQLYAHYAQRDPRPDQRFYMTRFDPTTGKYTKVDVTNRVLYVNQATGVQFTYSEGYKTDPTFGYGTRGPGWQAMAGAVTK